MFTSDYRPSGQQYKISCRGKVQRDNDPHCWVIYVRKTKEKFVPALQSVFSWYFSLRTIYCRQICTDGRPQEQRPSGECI